MKGLPILGMESLKNATHKEKNKTLMAGTKQICFKITYRFPST